MPVIKYQLEVAHQESTGKTYSTAEMEVKHQEVDHKVEQNTNKIKIPRRCNGISELYSLSKEWLR